jgi:hypothetical protein
MFSGSVQYKEASMRNENMVMNDDLAKLWRRSYCSEELGEITIVLVRIVFLQDSLSTRRNSNLRYLEFRPLIRVTIYIFTFLMIAVAECESSAQSLSRFLSFLNPIPSTSSSPTPPLSSRFQNECFEVDSN